MGLFNKTPKPPTKEEPVAPVVVVPGQVVTPEQTVADPDAVPHAHEYHPDGAAPAHDLNTQHADIVASNDEANNPLVQGKVRRDASLYRRKTESQAEYNERIPVSMQPVQPGPTHSYLGDKL